MPNRVNTLLLKQYETAFAGLTAVVAVGYPGMTVKDTHALRGELAKNNMKMTFLRNRIARIAFANLGLGPLDKVCDRMTALVWGEDVVAVARFLVSFQKKNAAVMKLHGALVDGVAVVGHPAVVSLSKSPTRPELLSILSGQATAPARRDIRWHISAMQRKT